MEIRQNTLYITTQGAYVNRDHLTLRVELEGELKLAVPIHHIESVCFFGAGMVSPQALQLCWENGIAVNYFSEHGYFLGRWEGVHNTSVLLRRSQYRAADSPAATLAVAKQCVAGKIQNSRLSLLRSGRESDKPEEALQLQNGADKLDGTLLDLRKVETLDAVRGCEGSAAAVYFGLFSLHLKQQRGDFLFTVRSRRPPLDNINCLLSFLYALLLHDCTAALTATGMDAFVGFLHSERPNRPSLSLDLMEEFRPLLADRLAVTLINRKQVDSKTFRKREGGAVELSDTGRKEIIKAYQTRKQDMVTHPLLNQELRVGQLMLTQARIMARYLRGEMAEYLPCVLR